MSSGIHIKTYIKLTFHYTAGEINNRDTLPREYFLCTTFDGHYVCTGWSFISNVCTFFWVGRPYQIHITMNYAIYFIRYVCKNGPLLTQIEKLYFSFLTLAFFKASFLNKTKITKKKCSENNWFSYHLMYKSAKMF